MSSIDKKIEKKRVQHWKRMIKKYGAKCITEILPGIVSDFTSEGVNEYDVKVYDAIYETMYAKKCRFITFQEIAETLREDSKARLSTAIMYLQSIHFNINDDIQSDICPELVAHFEYCGSVLPFKWARPTKDEKYLCISVIPDLSDEKQGLVTLEDFDVMRELRIFNGCRHLRNDLFAFTSIYKLQARFNPHIHFSLEPDQSDIALYEVLEKFDGE